MILAIIVGTLAGFLASKIMDSSGNGIFMDLLLGLVGGVLGRIAFGMVGIGSTGLIGSIIISTLGAMALIWIMGWVRSGRNA